MLRNGKTRLKKSLLVLSISLNLNADYGKVFTLKSTIYCVKIVYANISRDPIYIIPG